MQHIYPDPLLPSYPKLRMRKTYIWPNKMEYVHKDTIPPASQYCSLPHDKYLHDHGLHATLRNSVAGNML